MKRRDVIRNLSIAGAVSTLGIPALSFSQEEKIDSLRFIHMTDTHLFSERNAAEGLRKAFRHMRENYQDASFIINSGDVIMDALEKDRTSTAKQWALWEEITETENAFTMHNCIGNHDVWGGGSVGEDLYGKEWAVEALKMPSRYYSFDQGKWRFIMLDSTRINNNGNWYTAHLDEPQFEWLADILSDTPSDKNIMLVSHIPIVSATPYFLGESNSEKNGYWHFPHSWMHGDARRISGLLEGFPNVKGAISGHMHMVDRVEFKGVSYLCNGAISGAWWQGANNGFEPGYAVVDLLESGKIDVKYVPYNI